MSEKKYLDQDGLLYVKQKITNKFVAKENGKGLSTEDYTTAEKTKLAGLENYDDTTVKSDITQLQSDVADKVDKVEGKGLSTNDYTTAEKTKLGNIESGAQVNVIETVKVNNKALTPSSKGVNITVPTKTSDITNDSNFAVDSSYVHTDNNYTTAEKTKLGGISAGAQVNVIETVKVNGTAKTVTSKAVDITVPTKTSDITNDSNYVSDASYNHTDNNYTTTDKNKLGNIAAGAQVNVIESIKVNGTAQTITSKGVNISVPTTVAQLSDASSYALASNIPTNNNQLTNGAGYQTASDVNTAIESKIGAAYKAKGSIAFASLPTLGSNKEGFVYNVSDAFTTTSNFVEGAGKKYPAGTNVVCVDAGSSTYKWDVIAGFIDTDSFVKNSDIVAITNNEIDTIFA